MPWEKGQILWVEYCTYYTLLSHSVSSKSIKKPLKKKMKYKLNFTISWQNKTNKTKRDRVTYTRSLIQIKKP